MLFYGNFFEESQIINNEVNIYEVSIIFMTKLWQKQILLSLKIISTLKPTARPIPGSTVKIYTKTAFNWSINLKKINCISLTWFSFIFLVRMTARLRSNALKTERKFSIKYVKNYFVKTFFQSTGKPNYAVKNPWKFCGTRWKPWKILQLSKPFYVFLL